MATHFFLFSQGQSTQQQLVSDEIKVPYYLQLSKWSWTGLLWPLSDPPAPPKISLNGLHVWQWMPTVWTILCRLNCFTTFETQLIPFMLELLLKFNVTECGEVTHSDAHDRGIFSAESPAVFLLLSFIFFSAPPVFFVCLFFFYFFLDSGLGLLMGQPPSMGLSWMTMLKLGGILCTWLFLF